MFQVFFDVAYQSYLPSLVERDQIIEGNSKFEISRSAAQIGGPGLGGVLIEVLTAPYAVLVDAVELSRSGPVHPRHPQDRGAAPGERPTEVEAEHADRLKEGLRFVFSNPQPARPGGCTATSNFFSNFAFAIILVYFVRELGLTAGLIGVVFFVGAVGACSRRSRRRDSRVGSESDRRRSR